ncbi:hypothetical protein [Aliivibrio kagoshimensis]|jgi:hypothetical protein|uniref:hypothetical protein n=1 Tax=Aliivibrio kagoshimensis TaxID=2910230 RepID=UPI003D12FA53
MWATLEFESSGLTTCSYPIEVGYASSDGESYSLLIDPRRSGADWNRWDDEFADQKHSISLADLYSSGYPAIQVCQKLNQALCDSKCVFCSSQWNLLWLAKLYQAARMRPTYQVVEINQWLKENEGIDPKIFHRVLNESGNMKFRAEHDAIQIQSAIDKLLT